jgi:hypothetical protein
MKNARIAVVFLFISAMLVSVPSGVPAASDETGFRGIDWGADLSGRQDMRRISSEDAFSTYVRSTEDLSMADAVVTSVLYRTYHDRFVEVVIEAPVETRQGQAPGFESENLLAFKKVCHDRFGKISFAVTFETVRAEQYRWEYSDIRKILRINLRKNHMELKITDHALLENLKESPERLPVAGSEKTLKSPAGDESAGETTPAPSDVTGGTSASEEEKKDTPKGLEKAAKVLRWLFVNDNPATGDDPAVKPQ